MNYYQIHKNKKPKRLVKKSKRFISMVVPLVAMSNAMGLAQMKIIQSQPIPDDVNKPYTNLEKSIEIASVVINQFSALVNITKSEQQRRFKLTKRYVR